MSDDGGSEVSVTQRAHARARTHTLNVYHTQHPQSPR